jgi:hypothetical protein
MYMTSVSETVSNILFSDDIALEAIRQDILNYSAYAERIHHEVEKQTKRTVKTGTIVVSLARIHKKLEAEPALKPVVKVEDLTVKSPLYEVIYDKTAELLEEIGSLDALHRGEKDFLAITRGLSEIAMIGTQSVIARFMENITSRPKSQFDGLVCVTVRFHQKYLEIPNVLYVLVSSLAVKRINVIEIISTCTELSFIVQTEDLGVTMDALGRFLIED